MSKPASHQAGSWNLAIDYLPLLAFFAAFKLRGVFVGTGVFMAAIVVAVIVSKVKLDRVTPMLWLSAILVLGFGGLTIYFHDPKFIQLKVTLIYALFTAILAGGLIAGKPMLKYLLQAAFEGLDEPGWMKLSRNWAFFFFAMAVLNEVLRRKLGFDAWLTIKTWGITLASLAFGATNVPMLMKHGLGREQAVEVEGPLPPQG